MAAVLLACQMLEDEIQRAVQRTGAQMPIVWVDAGLHEDPDRLREELQRQIALLEQDYDTILLGFCLCGNALHGVRAARARLIAPRFDDCIRMLLCPAAGQAPAVDCRCLYYTASWSRHGSSILDQYDKTAEKYGEKKAKRVYAAMLKNYEGVRLVDTGGGLQEESQDYVRRTAQLLELNYGEVTGTCRVLEKLLQGAWDEEVCITAPGAAFDQADFLRRAAPAGQA